MFKVLKDKEFLTKFIKISLPVMIHALILFIVNFVDSLMIGSINDESVGAVYAVNQSTYILMIAAYGVIIGAGVFIQQFSGAGDSDKLKQSFRYKMMIMLIFMGIFITLYYLFGHHILYFFCHASDNSDVLFNIGKEYLYLIIASYIPYSLALIYSTTVREIGHTKYALISGLIALLSNVVFNAIFIYGFNMGVVGAGIGTIIARCIEFLVIIFLCHKKKFDFCDKLFKNFKIDKKLTINITKKGLVFLANEMFWVIGMTLLSMAYSQRANMLSSLSVVNSVGNIFNVLFQGLSVGIGVLVGSYLGEGKNEEAKEYAKKVYSLGFMASLLFGFLIIVLSPVIPYMFTAVNPENKQFASLMLVAYGFLMWGSCLYCCCYVTLKTGGEALVTFLIDSGLMWVIAVPLAWFLVLKTDLSLIYIYSIIVGIDIFKFIVSYHFVRKNKWLNNLTTIQN